MLHRSVFEDFGFFDEDLPACEDYDFWLRYSSKEEVIFINEPLIIKKEVTVTNFQGCIGEWTDFAYTRWKRY